MAYSHSEHIHFCDNLFDSEKRDETGMFGQQEYRIFPKTPPTFCNSL